MRLNTAQETSIREYLQVKIGYTCPVCGQREWKASDTLFALPEYRADSLNLNALSDRVAKPLPWLRNKEPQVFPVLPIVCGSCGFVFFISAVALGVVQAK
jgi:hypothetical protein